MPSVRREEEPQERTAGFLFEFTVKQHVSERHSCVLSEAVKLVIYWRDDGVSQLEQCRADTVTVAYLTRVRWKERKLLSTRLCYRSVPRLWLTCYIETVV